MSKVSFLLLLAPLLILTACSTPQMIMMQSKHYNPDHEQWLLELKSKHLTGKDNNQIALMPLQLENGYVTTYFFWEDNFWEDSSLVKTAKKDNRTLVPKSINIENADVTSRTNTVEKVIINNIDSIYPHDTGWFSTLIAKSEALAAGEHRIQFDGRTMFKPGTQAHFNYLAAYLENISFFADFKVSFQYDQAHDIYNTTIWLIKK